MDDFIKRVNDTYPISKNSWEALKNILEVKTYPPNYELVKFGQISDEAYYLIKGVARSYFTAQDGKEVNSILYTDNSYLAEFTSLILEKPSLAPIKTITECKVVKCKYSDFIELTNKHLDINILHRKNLETFYISLQNQDLDLANLNSTQRYQKLINEIPKIETLITQKNIAQHLGISQVQLSRIKKKLYSN